MAGMWWTVLVIHNCEFFLHLDPTFSWVEVVWIDVERVGGIQIALERRASWQERPQVAKVAQIKRHVRRRPKGLTQILRTLQSGFALSST